jgi:hypothetical protein
MKPENVHKITIASPCSVPWDSMKGDDFIRHCGQCKLNVFNLSAMTLDEVASLLEKKEGRMCVRFFRREDGTILTQDCPVGLAAVRRRLMLLGGTLATALVAAVQWVGPSALIRSLRSSPAHRLPWRSEARPASPSCPSSSASSNRPVASVPCRNIGPRRRSLARWFGNSSLQPPPFSVRGPLAQFRDGYRSRTGTAGSLCCRRV